MYKTTSSIPQNLKFVKSGDIWDTFYVNNSFMKLLKESLIHEYFGVKFLQVLNLYLSKSNLFDNIPRIIELYLEDDMLIGYRMEEKNGVSAIDYIQKSSDPVLEFYYFANSLLKTIMIGNHENIVFKDMSFNGNVLYEAKKKTASILDVDSFQIDNISDGYISNQILLSKVKTILLNHGKYYQEGHFTVELNFLLFYEIFLQALFHRSILVWYNSETFEDYLADLLKQINISKSSNLYGRMMDLANDNIQNSFDINDYWEFFNHYRFDVIRKRIQ